MPRFRIQLSLYLLSFLSLAPGARAEGLAQLTLEGVVDPQAGGRVEFSVGARRTKGGEPRQVDLGLHVAGGTTAADLLELLASRLESAGLGIVHARRSAAGATSSQLFVEDAIFLQVRIGYGLSATITACEAAPISLRVIGSDGLRAAGTLTMSASTWNLHTEKAGNASLAIELKEGEHGSGVAERLFRVATEGGWIADEWAPTRMGGGARVRGMSVRLDSKADWGLRVDFDLVR
jgi:hypothetical protein